MVAPSFAERLFVVILFLSSMGVVLGITRPYEAETDPSSIAAPVHVTDVVVQTLVQLCGGILILCRCRRVLKALQKSWPLLLLVSFAAMSAAWSSRPDLTLRRSTLLFVSMLMAVYIGERFRVDEQVALITQSFCVMIVAVAILRVASPQYVVDYVSHPGAWKGLSGYKNAFGQYMATAALLFLLTRFRRLSWARYGFLAAALAMLLFAQSAASVLCFCLIAPLIPLWRSNSIQGKQRLPILTAIGTVVFTAMYLFTTHSDRVFALLGRNSNMTGRSELWSYVWAAVMKHPLLGYGYDTFWAGLGEALEVRMGIGWMAQRSDNGFLDFGLGLGFVGVGLLVCVFVWSFRNAMKYSRYERQSFAVWPITYMAFFVLHNFSESTLFARGGLPDLLFMSTAVSLAVNHCELAQVHESDEDESCFVPTFYPSDGSYDAGHVLGDSRWSPEPQVLS
jgi:exopolysaccharide production protein ExoQ